MSRFAKVSLCRDDIFSSLNGNVYSMDRLSTAVESVKLFMAWISVVGVKMESGGGVMIGVGLTCE